MTLHIFNACRMFQDNSAVFKIGSVLNGLPCIYSRVEYKCNPILSQITEGEGTSMYVRLKGPNEPLTLALALASALAAILALALARFRSLSFSRRCMLLAIGRLLLWKSFLYFSFDMMARQPHSPNLSRPSCRNKRGERRKKARSW